MSCASLFFSAINKRIKIAVGRKKEMSVYVEECMKKDEEKER